MGSHRFIAAATIAATVALALLPARDGDAIPAFARRYKFSCSTCHAPFPRLKPYGEAFAARGFRLEDASQEPTRSTYDVGDPLLQLQRELPLAVRMDFFASYRQDAVAETDFEWPWAFKILSGGPITDSISYYFYGILEQGESIKLEDTFIQFNSIFHLPVDLMVGQFQVSDPLFKRELRLEREDYAIFKLRVGITPTDLTYDRGLVLTWHAPAEIDVVAEVLNGSGIGPAVDESFDFNNYKNTALHVSRWFGPVRLGAFGYQGKIGLGGFENRTTYLGPDVVANLGERWQINACALERRDDNAAFAPPSANPDDIVSRGGFAELHYFPLGQDGRWVLTALYNRITSDYDWLDVKRASVTANYLVARNFRVLLEGARDLQENRTRVTVGLVTAF